jgi:hypothetical protein
MNKHRWGVEPICRVLQFAPSTYYAARSRQPSSRQLRDDELKGRRETALGPHARDRDPVLLEQARQLIVLKCERDLGVVCPSSLQNAGDIAVGPDGGRHDPIVLHTLHERGERERCNGRSARGLKHGSHNGEGHEPDDEEQGSSARGELRGCRWPLRGRPGSCGIGEVHVSESPT